MLANPAFWQHHLSVYFLGIDCSHGQTRVTALDLESASLKAEATSPHHYLTDRPEGHVEQDPSVWIQAIDSAVRACLEQLGADRSRIAGIGVTAFANGIVMLDAENRILRPAKVGDDVSAGRQSEEISRAFGGAPGMIELGSNRCRATDAAARILWVKQSEPQIYQQTESILMPHDFINYWLTGIKLTEPGEASTTGLFDVVNRSWRKEILEVIDSGLEAKLPPVRSSREPHGQLRAELAEAWGVSPRVLVSAGSGEAMCEALGSGAVKTGVTILKFGEDAQLSVVSEQPLVDSRTEVQGRCDAVDRWLPTVRIRNAMSAIDMVCRHYQIDFTAMEQHAATAPAGSAGLNFLPYFTGESTPHFPEASAVLHGLNFNNFTVAHICRAAMEGVALSIAYGLNRLRELGVETDLIRITGRGASSPLLRQMLADACDAPIVALKSGGSAALGAALQAAVTFIQQSGETLSYEELANYLVLTDGETLAQPQEAARAVYEHTMSQQQYLADSLQGSGFL